MECVISVDLCPPYQDPCDNTWVQAGAKAGDQCTAACQTNGDGTRWCPTTDDHTGNIGTPWGWCPQAPTPSTSCDGGSGGGGAGGDADENDWTYVILILGTIMLYIVGGVAYNHKVKQQITLPHVEFWKNVGGLVKDGILFTKAKYEGKEGYQPVPNATPAASSTTGGPDAVTVVHIDEDGMDEDADVVEAMRAPPQRSPRAKKGETKKKKKKKKTKKMTEAAQAALENDGEDGGME